MERYREYKNSGVYYIPQIPSEWNVLKGKILFKQEKRPVNKEDEIVTCFRDGEVTLRKNRRLEGFTNSLKEIGYQGIRKGDLVIHNMDAFAGAIGVSDSDGKGTPVYAVCTPIREDANQFYYCYLLRFLAKTGFIQSLAKGIRERSTDFRYGDFKELLLPVPSRAEQDAIVRYLDSATSEIDKAIAMQQKMIDLLNERKQIIIQNAVTKGLDENVEMKESGVEWIGSIPKHWEVRKIKTVANFNPLPQRKFQQDEIVGYLPMERLGLGSMNPSEISYGKMPVGLNYIEDGDVVIAKVTPCFENGKIAIAKNLKNGCAFGTSEIYVYRPIKIDSVFLLYSLQNEQLKNKCASTMMGTGGLKRVNASFAKNVYITFPPTEKEQNEIGLFLENKISTFNKTIENIQRQITLLQERKQIIINEVVTGKVRVI